MWECERRGCQDGIAASYRLMCGGLAVLLTSFALGCGSTTQAQLTRCQEEKRQLLARVVDEQKRAESLTAELRSSNQRLAEAEKQLARGYDSRGRYATASGSNFTNNYGADGVRSAASPMNSLPGAGGGPPITREVELGAPRDYRPSDSRGGDASGVDLVGPRNSRDDSGWVPKASPRRQ